MTADLLNTGMQMAGFLIAAVLLGLVSGWLIFGGRSVAEQDNSAVSAERDALRLELDAAQRANASHERKIKTLKADVQELRDRASESSGAGRSAPVRRFGDSGAATGALSGRRGAADSGGAFRISSMARDAEYGSFRFGAARATDASESAGDADAAAAPEQSRPMLLEAPRNGAPDDLTRIEGIDSDVAAVCHVLGIFHLDQIAGWTDAELAWVDAHLAAFAGQASRDGWVGQAQALAATGDAPAPPAAAAD